MDTSFCSRCGFLLTGTSDLLQTGGIIPRLPAQTGFRVASQRNRGLKQGLFIFLMTFLVVPLVAIISVALGFRPWAIAIAAIVLFVGGLLRMAYAAMFESPYAEAGTFDDHPAGKAQSLDTSAGRSLPPQQSHPASSYISPATGNWRDTSELEPASVTEGTTKPLESEERHQ